MTPRILVACEYSGIVRDAFAARGWDAWSCDLLPTERPGNHHQGDVRDVLYQDWDLLIAHPPCTYLSNSGVRWLYTPDGDRVEERWRELDAAAAFFNLFQHTSIPHVAIENPVMHRHGIERVGGRASQFVQPYHFGVMETKRTGLRLYNLPPLVPTHDVEAEMRALPKRDTHKVHYASPGADRWKERSRTYECIAQAMADQWGPVIEDSVAALTDMCDCATLIPVHHMYCDRCQGIQDAINDPVGRQLVNAIHARKASAAPVEPSTNQERIMQ